MVTPRKMFDDRKSLGLSIGVLLFVIDTIAVDTLVRNFFGANGVRPEKILCPN
jgi:hypothetical protein